MAALRALLWDVDGTLAETERDGHLVAFNEAFAARELPWRWSAERYGELLAIAGGRERLLHDLAGGPCAGRPPDALEALARALHRDKNEHYARIVAAGTLPLRPGVAELIADCRAAGLAMGIVTTTSGANIEALLGRHLGRDWRQSFVVVIGAEEAPVKKPAPQAYHRALDALGFAGAETLAIEDAPAGVAAARAAGIPVILQRSHYFPETPAAGTLAAGPALGDGAGWVAPVAPAAGSRIDLALLRRWHGTAQRAAG